MPLCNTQTALPEEATQLLWEMSAGTKELKLEVLVLLEDIWKDVEVIGSSSLDTEFICKE